MGLTKEKITYAKQALLLFFKEIDSLSQHVAKEGAS